MKELNASLLRERFVIHGPGFDPNAGKKPVIALSNRIVVELRSDKGHLQEAFAIRTQNMHSCTRMAARLIQSFNRGGPIINRQTPYDWEASWDAITSDHERKFNEENWISVYRDGQIVFENGERHPFLDVIEKCDAGNPDSYDVSIPIAEKAFKETGKVVEIEYDGNVALVANLERKQGRCGIILRGPDRTTTFNFTAHAGEDTQLSFPLCLTAAAAFLEGIQMAFMIGTNEAKINRKLIDRLSKEAKQTDEGRRRLARLNAEITSMENMYDVHYRPERPDFKQFLVDAEELTEELLASDQSETENPENS